MGPLGMRRSYPVLLKVYEVHQLAQAAVITAVKGKRQTREMAELRIVIFVLMAVLLEVAA